MEMGVVFAEQRLKVRHNLMKWKTRDIVAHIIQNFTKQNQWSKDPVLVPCTGEKEHDLYRGGQPVCNVREFYEAGIEKERLRAVFAAARKVAEFPEDEDAFDQWKEQLNLFEDEVIAMQPKATRKIVPLIGSSEKPD